jgi:hypothetical protein
MALAVASSAGALGAPIWLSDNMMDYSDFLAQKINGERDEENKRRLEERIGKIPNLVRNAFLYGVIPCFTSEGAGQAVERIAGRCRGSQMRRKVGRTPGPIPEQLCRFQHRPEQSEQCASSSPDLPGCAGNHSAI